MPDDPPVSIPPPRVRFVYSPVGDGAIARAFLQDDIVLKRVVERERRIRMLKVAACLPIMWVAIYMMPDRELWDIRVTGATLVTALCGVLMLMWARSSGMWPRYVRQARTAADNRLEQGNGVSMEVELSPRGVRAAYSDQAHEFGWKYFDRVRTVEGYIALCFANAINGVAVPRSAFATPFEADAFEASARALLDESGYSMRDRAREMVQGDCGCAACGYNLKGLKSDSCPECGHELTTFSLWCMRYLAEPLWLHFLGRSHVLKEWSKVGRGG